MLELTSCFGIDLVDYLVLVIIKKSIVTVFGAAKRKKMAFNISWF